MMNILEIMLLVLKFIAVLSSIGFTYVRYRDYKERQKKRSENQYKKKGSSDAGTSDKPDNSCSKNS
jgi:hypothetical protein